MKLFLICMMTLSCVSLQSDRMLPTYLLGDFTDDYNIKYTVTDTTWTQWPDFQMNILTINTAEMYILGYDTSDSTYTRVDYMPFDNQGAFEWGFCYTAYEKQYQADALAVESADRQTPKTGCNGFPFSRMKRLER